MQIDAIHELITAAKALSPSGEIGDGKVAHFHHLAERASAELAAFATVAPRETCRRCGLDTSSRVHRMGCTTAQCPHGEPLAAACPECHREHREATA